MENTENRIEKFEEQIKVINLKVYKKETLKKNLKLNTKISLSLLAIPVSLAAAKSIFGINFEMSNVDPSFVTNTINILFDNLSNWSIISFAAPLTIISGAVLSISDTNKSVNKMKKLKYFVENKDAINKVEENITVLDAFNCKEEQLEEYANKGRSKVLR